MTFEWLTTFTWQRYASMTLAPYRELLESPAVSGRQHVALGVSEAGRPVGLALVQIDADRTAECLSIYVVRDQRGRGVGTELLERLEIGLAELGCSAVALRYDANVPEGRHLERLLTRHHWPTRRQQLRFLMLDGGIAAASWFRTAVLAPPYSIASWSSVTEAERRALWASQQARAWIPDELLPSRFETGLDSHNSLVLRHDDAVVGWALLRPVDDRTVHYANVFADPLYNRAGRTFATLALVAAAVRRQVQQRGVRSRGIFEIAPHNTSFLRFADRHLRPFLLLDRQLTRVVKVLTPAVSPPGTVPGWPGS